MLELMVICDIWAGEGLRYMLASNNIHSLCFLFFSLPCRPPPRPSPGSIVYSEEEESKHYEDVHRRDLTDLAESSSLTEKSDLHSQSESQVSCRQSENLFWLFFRLHRNNPYMLCTVCEKSKVPSPLKAFVPY